MNYKLPFPTYRNRYLFVKENLARRKFTQALNLGTGEGGYDPMIAARCEYLTGCDIPKRGLSKPAKSHRVSAAVQTGL